MNAESLTLALGGKWHANAATPYGSARCPAHDDREPSLSISDRDGKLLFKCHAGCDQFVVLERLLDMGLWKRAESVPDWHVNGTDPGAGPGPSPNGPTGIVATYRYRDAAGRVLYETVRLEPKSFRQRRRDPDTGAWIWNLRGVTLVPYRLPELLAADPARPVFVVEGEKDADRLAGLGMVATCNPLGAGKWRPEYGAHFAARHVVILPDADPVGRQHAEAVAANLVRPAASVRVLELPGLGDGGDVSDWLSAGGCRDELERLAREAPALERPLPEWQILDAADFLAIEYPSVRWRIEGYVRDRAVVFNFGPPGAIKTYIATDAALAIVSGGKFLGEFRAEPGRVLIVQEDTVDSDYQTAYLRPMLEARGLTPEDVRGRLFVAPPGGFSLEEGDALASLEAWLAENPVDLIIFDAFYLLHNSPGYGKELVPVLRTIKRLRQKYETAIWIIDHDRKSQGDKVGENPVDRLYGGREKSAALDVLMESKPVRGDKGAAFLEVHKSRGVIPADPVQIRYSLGKICVEGSLEETLKGSAQLVYEWLRREGGSRTVKQIQHGTDLSIRSVRSAMTELVKLDLIRTLGTLGTGQAKTWIASGRVNPDAVEEGLPWD